MRASLLAVFAHPDDEALRCGGTLARYADRGAAVTVACLTRGEAGKNTDPALAVSDMGTQREGELRQACALLGISPPVFLDYQDSGRGERLRRTEPLACINADPLETEAKVLDIIHRVRPQVLLTFDPHGIYGHPDHLVAHRAATGAFSRSGHGPSSPRRLFYVAQTVPEMRGLQSGRGLGVLGQLDPEVYAVSDGTVAAWVDVRAYADRKRAALAAHRTQTGPLSTLGTLSPEQLAPLLRRETFSLGGLRGPLPAYPLDDLFAGLDVVYGSRAP
ncbi:PIG-L deacetylase family protein [Deinococcus sp. Leaf326]|uniref:PIG-L deacetylase family protein n=1 Tax=Deinococcus sp. Leaf326 TaxID=1736338 RepID=UPI0006F98D5D|nr:PIG-L deacetylase family protein [Deinococcus sp. Leaf326]KQR23017.1 LmbE-like protein [Deinococcus sp. Leaf326]